MFWRDDPWKSSWTAQTVLRGLYQDASHPYTANGDQGWITLDRAEKLVHEGWAALTRTGGIIRAPRYRIGLTRKGQEELAAYLARYTVSPRVSLYSMAVVLRQDMVRGFQTRERAVSRFLAVCDADEDRAMRVFAPGAAEDHGWADPSIVPPNPHNRVMELYWGLDDGWAAR